MTGFEQTIVERGLEEWSDVSLSWVQSGGGGEREGGAKLQALVYDILPSWWKVPESDARSVALCRLQSGQGDCRGLLALVLVASGSQCSVRSACLSLSASQPVCLLACLFVCMYSCGRVVFTCMGFSCLPASLNNCTKIL